MSIITNEWTYNDLPIVIADPERYPAAARKANSWMQPVGPECGRGWVLMTKADVLACKHSTSNSTYTLFQPKTLKVVSTVPDGSGKPVQKTLTVQNVIILSAKVVSKGQDDEHTIMLVELVDQLYLTREHGANININLRRVSAADDSTTDASYYEDNSLDAGSVFTWDRACEVLWNSCTSFETNTWPGLPYTPLMTGPQNLQCVGRSAYATLYGLLRQLGCTMARYLTEEDDWTFNCVRLGYVQTGLSTVESDWDHLRTWEDETIVNTYSLCSSSGYYVPIPGQRFASLNWPNIYLNSSPGVVETTQFKTHGAMITQGVVPVGFTVGSGTSFTANDSTSVISRLSSTYRKWIWSSYPSDDLAGESGSASAEAGGVGCTINEHVGELAKAAWDMAHYPLPARTIYAGILPDFRTGSEVRAIIWRNYGPDRGNDGGPKTEVIKYPGWPKPIYSPSGWAERIELGDDIASEWPGPQAGNSPGAWRAGPDPAAYVYNVTGGTDTTINGVDYWAVNDADLVGETRQGVCTVSFFSPAGSNPAYIRKAAAFGVGVLTGSYEAHPSTGRAVPHYTVWPAFTAVPVDIVTDVTGAGITVTKTTLWVGDDGVL